MLIWLSAPTFENVLDLMEEHLGQDLDVKIIVSRVGIGLGHDHVVRATGQFIDKELPLLAPLHGAPPLAGNYWSPLIRDLLPINVLINITDHLRQMVDRTADCAVQAQHMLEVEVGGVDLIDALMLIFRSWASMAGPTSVPFLLVWVQGIRGTRQLAEDSCNVYILPNILVKCSFQDQRW